MEQRPERPKNISYTEQLRQIARNSGKSIVLGLSTTSEFQRNQLSIPGRYCLEHNGKVIVDPTGNITYDGPLPTGREIAQMLRGSMGVVPSENGHKASVDQTSPIAIVESSRLAR